MCGHGVHRAKRSGQDMWSGGELVPSPYPLSSLPLPPPLGPLPPSLPPSPHPSPLIHSHHFPLPPPSGPLPPLSLLSTPPLHPLLNQMSRYPRLRDETERILTTFLREQEQKCKDHVSRGERRRGDRGREERG